MVKNTSLHNYLFNLKIIQINYGFIISIAAEIVFERKLKAIVFG